MEKSFTVSKTPAVILKKELAQKTDALNSALKRENQLKVCVRACVCTRVCACMYVREREPCSFMSEKILHIRYG